MKNESWFPLGIPWKQERFLLWTGLLLSAGAGLVLFLCQYLPARRALYGYNGTMGPDGAMVRVLLPGTLVPPFPSLLYGPLLCFLALALSLAGVAVYHFLCHYQGGRSIYRMRLLPQFGELWRRCLSAPALALLLGGVYLIVRGVIRARIPVAYIATVAVLTFLFPLGGNDRLVWMTYQLFTGGLFLGAFFMATDYVTSPVTKKGEIIFGIGCGLLTVFIRYFGGYPEGVSYSILIMNCCVWLIDKVGKPGRYGVTKEMKAAAKAAKKAGKEG